MIHSTRNLVSISVLVGALTAVAACGSDPVSYSAPVGITLTAKSGDVSGTSITEIKNINTESGNPYGAFISDARAHLNGKDPSSLDLPSATLVLDPSSGITKLEEVFTGDMVITFVMNDSNTTYAVGHVMNPTGAGPANLEVSFDSTTISSADYPKFVGGSFKVVMTGTVAASFAGKGATANLRAVFTFDAFE